MKLGKKMFVVLGAAALLAAVSPVQAQEAAPPDRSREKVKVDPDGAPPPIPVADIIRQFAAKEADFRVARGNYTYTQTVRVEEFSQYGDPGGQFQRTSEVIFTPEGKRYERITREPPTSLRLVSMSLEDLKDLENIQPFVLTTEELTKYELEYLGRQQIDEIGTYVFGVKPRKIEPSQRYFQGTVWVDDRDLQIVKSHGKAVPDIQKKSQENLFPMFETWRENIDGKYWFPTLTRADDVLHFKNGDVRIKMTVRYANYKQFKSTTRILSAEPVKPEEKKPPQP